MHGGRIDILREVVITGTGTLGTYTATSLLTELRQRSTLDIAQMTYRDHHWIVRVEVLCIELMLIRYNLRTARIAIFLFHFLQLILHHLLAALGIVKNLLQVGNQLL